MADRDDMLMALGKHPDSPPRPVTPGRRAQQLVEYLHDLVGRRVTLHYNCSMRFAEPLGGKVRQEDTCSYRMHLGTVYGVGALDPWLLFFREFDPVTGGPGALWSTYSYEPENGEHIGCTLRLVAINDRDVTRNVPNAEGRRSAWYAQWGAIRDDETVQPGDFQRIQRVVKQPPEWPWELSPYAEDFGSEPNGNCISRLFHQVCPSGGMTPQQYMAKREGLRGSTPRARRMFDPWLD